MTSGPISDPPPAPYSLHSPPPTLFTLQLCQPLFDFFTQSAAPAVLTRPEKRL